MDWHNARTKAELAIRGLTMASIARDNGIAPSTMRAVMHKRYRRGELLIAQCLGVSPETIWPSRYGVKK